MTHSATQPDRPRALVTGAAFRLGRAMALDLAATGWDVAIHYNRSAEGAEATAAEARALGANAVTVQANLFEEAETETLIARTVEAMGGPLTVLINNASWFENDEIASMTRGTWDRAFESNLRAPVKLTQDFLEQAPKAELDRNGEPVARAVVINMIDQRVWKPTPFFMSYLMAKTALLTFTKTVAQAVRRDARIAAIGPGPTIIAEGQSEDHYAMQRRNCMLERGSDPEDVVSAMRFILANKAFTGQMLAIDGGQHLAWQTPDVRGMVE